MVQFYEGKIGMLIEITLMQRGLDARATLSSLSYI